MNAPTLAALLLGGCIENRLVGDTDRPAVPTPADACAEAPPPPSLPAAPACLDPEPPDEGHLASKITWKVPSWIYPTGWIRAGGRTWVISSSGHWAQWAHAQMLDVASGTIVEVPGLSVPDHRCGGWGTPFINKGALQIVRLCDVESELNVVVATYRDREWTVAPPLATCARMLDANPWSPPARCSNGEDCLLQPRGMARLGGGCAWFADDLPPNPWLPTFAAPLEAGGQPVVVLAGGTFDLDGGRLSEWGAGQTSSFGLADLDLDGDGDIVAIEHFSGDDTNLSMYDHDGSARWTVPLPDPYGIESPPPAWPVIQDLNGDRRPDILIVQPFEARAYTGDGSLLWARELAGPVPDNWGDFDAVRDSVFAAIALDLEADGRPELVLPDEDGLLIVDGRTGATRLRLDGTPGLVVNAPWVGDFDEDGHQDILATEYDPILAWDYSYEPGKTLHVWSSDAWAPYTLGPWTTPSFNATGVAADGGIPVDTVAPWAAGYNSFRSSAVRDDGRYRITADASVVIDECVRECPGATTVWVRVFNAGPQPLPADTVVRASLAANPSVVLMAESLGTELTAGTYSRPFAVSGPGTDVIEVKVDAEGVAMECDERNNSLRVKPTPCTDLE